MRHFLESWLDWGWAWMLIGLCGYMVAVFFVPGDDA